MESGRRIGARAVRLIEIHFQAAPASCRTEIIEISQNSAPRTNNKSQLTLRIEDNSRFHTPFSIVVIVES